MTAHIRVRPSVMALDSPALRYKSPHYPPHFEKRVPWKVRMLRTVRPDFTPDLLRALGKPLDTVAIKDGFYECWVNSHGAVAVICSNGEKLGVRPDEFEIVEWHK